MSELVLALYRNCLQHQNIPLDATGIFNIDLHTLNSHDYALLPRHIADLKNKQTKQMPAHILELGKTFPQILGYYQIVNREGKFLAYQRKGKEKGLFGQWSIGIGGHVDLQDLHEVADHTGEDTPDIGRIIYAGALREIQEELGIDANAFEELSQYDDFEQATNRIIQSYNTETSSVHLGLPIQLHLCTSTIEEEDLKLNPDEFLNIKWADVEELKTDIEIYEDWSQLLIEKM